MISRLSGKLIEKQPPTIVVDVQGVGYEVDVSMSTFYQLPATGQDVKLFTHLVVREDAHLLFGFATEDERRTFRQLLKISGIGARTALALLSGLSAEELRVVVRDQDAARLTRIPGVGKKTAERLLLELKDKLAPPSAASASGSSSAAGNDALNALLSLGYNDKDARSALTKLSPDLSLQESIRQALRSLSKIT